MPASVPSAGDAPRVADWFISAFDDAVQAALANPEAYQVVHRGTRAILRVPRRHQRLPIVLLVALFGTQNTHAGTGFEGRFEVGGALGSSYFYDHRGVDHGRSTIASPIAGAAVGLRRGQLGCALGVETLPTFVYDIGGVLSIPGVMLRLGAEYNPGRASLGLSGTIGLLALSAGPHLRYRIAEGDRWAHDLEARAHFYPPNTYQWSMSWSPVIRLGRGP